MNERVAVMGAGGHTGSFVVAELRRGMTPIPCGRATDLDLALHDADAVINCAGPFAATAAPVIESAIRAGIPYLDVTAEIEVATDCSSRAGDAPRIEWTFPAPIGTRPVVGEFTMADSATIPTHLNTPEIATYMSSTPSMTCTPLTCQGRLRSTRAPRSSAQTLLVEVVACSDGMERRAAASGQDIYAVTAPLVVEAATRRSAGAGDTAGVASVGARFDGGTFLGTLSQQHLTLG